VNHVDQPVVIAMENRFMDAGNRDAIMQVIQRGIGDANRVVLDMQRLEFIDSSGMGSLLALANQLEQRGGLLVLARPSGPVNTAFGIVYMNRKIAVHADLATAKSAWQDGRQPSPACSATLDEAAELLDDQAELLDDQAELLDDQAELLDDQAESPGVAAEPGRDDG
jgi:anti-anti-sigma factor